MASSAVLPSNSVNELRRQRVLFVVGSLNPGGIERLTSDICVALKKTGDWQPSVCCVMAREGPFLKVLEDNGVDVHECKLNSRNFLSFPLRFASMLKRLSPDIIHSHVAFSIPWQVLGARLAGQRAIVFTQQNDYQHWKQHRWSQLRIRTYYRLVRPFISAHTAVSEQVRRSFAQLVNQPESRFRVVYNSVDVEAFKPNPELRAAARQQFGVSETDYVIGSVASLSPQKAHSILLRALQQITREQPNTRLVLIGDGPLRGELERQVQESSLQHAVIFLGARADAQKCYQGFDCFALSSLWEGFPLVIAEAMACGLPIVATGVGGVPEALENGSCGVLVPAGNPNALADAILGLVKSPDKARLLGDRARRRAITSLSVEASMREYLSIYREAMGTA